MKSHSDTSRREASAASQTQHQPGGVKVGHRPLRRRILGGRGRAVRSRARTWDRSVWCYIDLGRRYGRIDDRDAGQQLSWLRRSRRVRWGVQRPVEERGGRDGRQGHGCGRVEL
jgi:hypothetical protein